MRTSIIQRATPPAAVVLVIALLQGCGSGGASDAGSSAAASTAASTPSPAPSPTAATPTAGATTSPPAGAPASTPAPVVDAQAALIAKLTGRSWRQICLPFLPGDGASDGTHDITITGTTLVVVVTGRDYANTACLGAGTVLGRQTFTETIVGTGTVGGITVLKTDGKSVLGLDADGRLRYGDETGPRDATGYPVQLEPPSQAYLLQG